MYAAAFGPLLGSDSEEMAALLEAKDRTLFLTTRISNLLTTAFEAGDVRGIRALVALHGHVERITHATEGISRIDSTPEPWAYQKTMRATMALWLGLLPLALLPELGPLWTPALGGAIAGIVLKLDDVAVEAQNPFGVDLSDISLCYLNESLKGQIAQVLKDHVVRVTNLPLDHEVVPQAEIDKKVDEWGMTSEQIKNKMI